MEKKMERFRVHRNGTRISSFDTLRKAKGYITRLYNSGNVLPDDQLLIFDRMLLMYVNF